MYRLMMVNFILDSVWAGKLMQMGADINMT